MLVMSLNCPKTDGGKLKPVGEGGGLRYGAGSGGEIVFEVISSGELGLEEALVNTGSSLWIYYAEWPFLGGGDWVYHAETLYAKITLIGLWL